MELESSSDNKYFFLSRKKNTAAGCGEVPGLARQRPIPKKKDYFVRAFRKGFGKAYSLANKKESGDASVRAIIAHGYQLLHSMFID